MICCFGGGLREGWWGLICGEGGRAGVGHSGSIGGCVIGRECIERTTCGSIGCGLPWIIALLLCDQRTAHINVDE